jgi:hypothetical protein
MKRKIALGLLFVCYAFTVLIRKHFHAEPYETLWVSWVFAQGICAAGLGYSIGRYK